TLKPGNEIFISGTLKWIGKKLAFVSPEYEIYIGKNINTSRIVTIYHETKRVSSKLLRSSIAKVFPQIKDQFSEYYDKPTLDKYNLSEKDTAIEYVHFPKSQKEIEEGIGRLAFDELLFIQLRAILRKKEWEATNQAHELTVSQKD